MKRAAVGLALLVAAVVLAGCVRPVPPAPTPRVPLGGRQLYFPLAMIAPYRWQRAGYGRPTQAVVRDQVLRGRALWHYTWGLGDCLYGVPMVFDGHDLPAPEVLARCAATAPVLLVFNEPEYQSQGDTTPAEAARALRYLEEHWPGELWCCGNLVSSHGWLDQMLTAYKAEYGEMPRLAGVHLHVYVAGGFTDIQDPEDRRWLARSQANLKTYLDVMRKWGVPARVVVSECCLLGKYPEGVYLKVQDAYMRWLRSEPAVESVAWFSARYGGFPDANMLEFNGELTAVGEAWLAWRWR